MFETNKEMYKNIKAAQILGVGEETLSTIMEEKGIGNAYKYLSAGEFKPYEISDSVKKIFQQNADQLGITNPLDYAQDVMDRILDVLENSSILNNFPEMENPFRTSMLPTMGPSNNVSPLPPMITSSNPSVLAANQQLVPQLNNLPKTEQYKVLFPNG